jgi:upstream activation factor subunit UAF30
MPDLSPQQIELFTPIIDKILDNADLTTITPKKIINGLQEKLGYDITEFKVRFVLIQRLSSLRVIPWYLYYSRTTLEPDTSERQILTQTFQQKEVKKLINQRFDVASAKQDATNTTSTPQSSTTITNSKNHKPATNGTSTTSTTTANKSHKRPSPSSSTTSSSPPPKKHKSSSTPKQGKSMESLDAELAARLQAEENGRARSTRGGSGATSATVRKRGTPSGKKGGPADLGSAKKKKRVSKATLDSADDSEVEGSGVEKKEKEKKGGFHKPMVLSQTLSEFFGGEEKVCFFFIHFWILRFFFLTIFVAN